MPPHPSLFTHRSYFEKYGLFDNQFKMAMDYELFIRGGISEKVVHIPALVTCVRDGGVSTLRYGCVVDEIILALKKNGYFSSTWAELKVRAYFKGRAFVKSVLIGVGFYKAFDRLRNKL